MAGVGGWKLDFVGGIGCLKNDPRGVMLFDVWLDTVFYLS
jgi:hypothetical protein